MSQTSTATRAAPRAVEERPCLVPGPRGDHHAMHMSLWICPEPLVGLGLVSFMGRMVILLL